MSDLWHTFLKMLDYNRYLVLGIMLTVGLSAWLIGCEIQTPSLMVPREKVTERVFEAEVVSRTATLDEQSTDLAAEIDKHNIKVAAFNEQVAMGREDIERQYEIRREVLTLAAGIAESVASGGLTAGGAINAVVSALMLLGGGGAYLDKRRTNQVVTCLKTENAELRANTTDT